jgi:hypothetical protein
VAPSWLWPALIARLIAEAWNVNAARSHAGRLKDLPRNLPSWVDRETLAKTSVEGTVRPGDMAHVIGAAVRATGSALLPRLGRRQGVAAVLQVEPANHVEAHDRELDLVLRVPVGKRGDDRGLGSGHAVGEQHQYVGRDPRDRGVEVGGGPGLGRGHAGQMAKWHGLAKALKARSG